MILFGSNALFRRSVVSIVSAAVFVCTFQSFPKAFAGDAHGRVTSRVGRVRLLDETPPQVAIEVTDKYESDAKGLVDKAKDDINIIQKSTKKEKGDDALLEKRIQARLQNLTAALNTLKEDALGLLKRTMKKLGEISPEAQKVGLNLLEKAADAAAKAIFEVRAKVKDLVGLIKKGWEKATAFFNTMKSVAKTAIEKVKKMFFRKS
ncbi:hypothetical protein [Streptomyces aureoversilis]|uniref:Secreted protein n=1 Tax=Streptomyces aureoversilis TaxID=67277 RepID=A0ABW0A8K0_9ACTN